MAESQTNAERQKATPSIASLDNTVFDETTEKQIVSELFDKDAKTTSDAASKTSGGPGGPGGPAGPGGDNIVYPSTSKQILTMTSLAMCALLISLDRTILATATPTITNEFNSISQVGWYASAYMLTMCAFMLLFGRVYTFYNPKVVFMSCIFVFEVGSAICGAAPNSTAFIIGRAVAGTGASALMGGVMLIVFSTIPLHRRPLLTSFMSAVWGISSVAGPLLGGAFTTKVTWRWCFFINLPIGGAVLVYLFFFLQVPPAREANLSAREKLQKLDPLGTAVLLPCIVCLLLALEWGGNQYAWSSWRIILLLVLFGVLLIAFVGIQLWKQESATLPPRIAKQRTIAFAAIGQLFVGASLTIITYYLPIWFQAIQHVDAVESGIRNLPLVLALVVSSISTGVSVSRVGYYTPFMIVGLAIMTVGCGLLTLLRPDSSEGYWFGFQIVVGFGLGMAMQQANMAAQTVLERKDIATGSSIMFFAQSLGGAIFVSVGQSVFTNKLSSGLAHVPGLDVATVTSVGATDLYNYVPQQLYPQVLDYYNDAIVKGAFVVAIATTGLACLSSLGIEWRSVKKNKKQDQQTQADAKAKAGQEAKGDAKV